MRRLYALIGDIYHPPEYIREGLRLALPQGSSSLAEITIETQPDNIPWNNLDSGDVLVLFKDTKTNPKKDPDALWMTEAYETLIEGFVRKGGGLIVLHSGIVIHPNCITFRSLTKGRFLGHPEDHPVIRITPGSTAHPLLKGIEAFSITDEQYFVELDRDDTETLLHGESTEHGPCPVGWAHTHGAGRICCLTPGHTLEVLSHSMVQKLIRNSVNWCQGN